MNTRTALPLLLTGILVACGGGGGGSDGGGGQYSGSITAATVDAAAAPALASNALDALLLAYGIGAGAVDDTSTIGSINQTIPGPSGGSVRVRGQISNGSGSLTFDYSAYRDANVVIDGRETVSVLAQQSAPWGPYNSSLRHVFNNYAVSFTDLPESYRLNGDIRITRWPISSLSTPRLNSTITGELLITRAPDNRQAQVTSMSLTRTYQESLQPGEGQWLLSGTARVHDSVAGYLDASVENPLQLREIDPGTGPAFGGSLRLTGAGGGRFWISPLTREYVALELDTDADGIPDRALSYRWSSDFEEPATVRDGVLAVSGPDLFIDGNRSPGPLQLEGRFSEHSEGRFLSHQWSLIFTPPGSTATISRSGSTRAQFTPDRNGTYVFRLRVGDGDSHSSDFFTLRATGYPVSESLASAGSGPAWHDNQREARVVLEPDLVASPDTLLNLDGSRSYTPDGTPLQAPQWNVLETSAVGTSISGFTPGFQLSLSATQARLAAGFLVERLQSGQGPSGDQVVIIPPTNRRMAPTATLPAGYSDGTNTASVEGVDDFNADGIDDYVLVDKGDPLRLRIMLGSPDGRLRQLGDVLTLPQLFVPYGTPVVSTGDLNGDSLPDLVLPDATGIGYFLQTGNPAAPVAPYQTAASGCAATNMLRLVDVEADGDLDVVSRHDCSPATASGLAVYLNAGGQLEAATQVTLDGVVSPLLTFAMLDLNGDSRADIIGINQYSQALAWLAGNAPAHYVPGPALPAGLSLSHQSWPRIADLDANGRPDLIASGTALQIMWQATDGTLSHQALGSGSTMPGTGQVVALRDFDGDGRTDLLGPNGWYGQTGDGQFAHWQAYARGYAQNSADINGDGQPDLLDGISITLQAPPD